MDKGNRVPSKLTGESTYHHTHHGSSNNAPIRAKKSQSSRIPDDDVGIVAASMQEYTSVRSASGSGSRATSSNTGDKPSGGYIPTGEAAYTIVDDEHVQIPRYNQEPVRPMPARRDIGGKAPIKQVTVREAARKTAPMPTLIASRDVGGKAPINHLALREAARKTAPMPTLTARRDIGGRAPIKQLGTGVARKSVPAYEYNHLPSSTDRNRAGTSMQREINDTIDPAMPDFGRTISASVTKPRMRNYLFTGRKSASKLANTSYNARLSLNAPPQPQGVPTVFKSSKIIVPTWQREDEEFESTRATKRMRQEREIDAGVDRFRRISIMSTRRGNSARDIDGPGTGKRENKNRESSYLAPGFKIIGDGMDADSSSSDSDVDMLDVSAGRRQAAKKTAGVLTQAAAKLSGARKIKTLHNGTSSSEEESTSDSSESQREVLRPASPTREDSPTTELEMQTRRLKVEEEDMTMSDLQIRPYGPPELIYLDSPPPILIDLPQIEPTPPNEMPIPLIESISELILPSLLMQKEHRLPFLLRSVKKGFRSRCIQLEIPIGSKKGKNKEEEILVSYEGAGGLKYETRTKELLCPLCELFGRFNTREMLAFHLSCDHSEVYVEWSKIEYGRTWKLHILVPEEIIEEPSDQPVLETESSDIQQDGRAQGIAISSTAALALHEETPIAESQYKPTNPHTPQTLREFIDLFPSVALSPPSARVQPRAIMEQTPTKPKWLLTQRKTSPSSASTGRQTTASLSVSTSARSRTVGSSRLSITVGRSTTMTTTQGVQRDASSRYPTPPPPDDPLGPSARYPYLPAESDYGGPTVYYSCRPNGPCLFDLLQTLPLEPFGVLEWAITEREEEIYESDDMKEEYKVMNALWARWICLNRNQFVTSPYKGTIAFVDEYWKIIHRAAGWDALRYWLMVLTVNRFLTNKDVAKILKHYESYIGIDYW